MGASVVRSDLLLGLSCLLPVASSAAGDFHPFDGPRPVAIFLQTDPWAAVLGADDPRVAIYEDGQVIYAKTVGEHVSYRTFTLDAAGLAHVRDVIAPVLGLEDLEPHYDVMEGTTDQPEARIYLSAGDRAVTTSISGLVAGETLPAAAGASASCPPREVRELHAWFSKLDDDHSVEWEPKYVEVMLSDFPNSAGQSISWPDEWPSLQSERALKREDGWSIFLDGSQLPRLRVLLATRQPSAALAIAGRKMAVSWRRTFPGEPVWREAFERPVASSPAVVPGQPPLPVDLNFLPPMDPIMDVRPEELAQLIDKADRVVVRDWSEETRKRDKVLYESKERADIDALGRAVSLRVPEDWTHCMCLGSVEVTLYTGENLLGSFTNQHTRNIRCSLWQSDAELADPEAFVSWFDARNMTGPRTEYDELKQQEAEFEAVQAKWLAAMPKCLIPLWTERARYGPQALDLEPFRTTLATEIADRNERVLALLEWYGWEGGSWSEYYDFEGVAKALLMDYPTAVLNAIGSSMELSYAQTKGLARLFTDETFRYQRRDELADLSHRLKRRLREHAHASEDEGEIAAVQHAFGNDW